MQVSTCKGVNMKRILSLAICAIAAFSAAATTYYVDKENGSDDNDGKAPERAFKTANKGFSTININENRGSELIIAPGEYPLTEAIGCNGGGSESKRSHVRSSTDRPEDVVIYSDGTFECLRLGQFITVSSITLSNGVNRADCAGGGIRFSNYAGDDYRIIVSNCIVTCCSNVLGTGSNGGAAVAIYGRNLMIDSVIRDNTACADGGGVLMVNNNSYNGVPRLERCRIERNVAAGKGGGVFVANVYGTNKHQSNGEAVELVDCEIIGNSAANGAGVHFATTNMTANLTGCVISNNTSATGNSGGIRLENGANMVMRNCLVEGNAAGSGAGADVIGKSATAVTTLVCSNTVFRKNAARGTGGGMRIINNYAIATCDDTFFRENSAATSGGGVYISGQGKGFFDNCRFDGNAATGTANGDSRGGGGLFMGDQTSSKKGYCSVSNCVFASNTSGFRAGGMGHTWNTNCFCAAIVNCIFTNNQSRTQGGGLVIRESTANPTPAIVRNCLFAFNRTTQNGGATDNSDANGGGVHFATYSDVVLENCTIVSNSVGNTKNNVSGGIHHRYGGKLKNCIVAFNTVNGVSDADKLSSGNTAWTLNDAAYEYCCGYPAVTRFKEANHCIAADPKFVDPANGDFTLQVNSPCKEAGVYADWMATATDLAGNRRVRGSKVDIGCYEAPVGMTVLLK